MWSRRPIPFYFVSYVILGFGFSVLGPALPTLQAKLDVTEGEVSILFTFLAFGGFVGALIVGRLYDKGFGHRLLGIGVAGFGLAAMLIAVPTKLGVLALVVFCLGFMGSTIDVGGNALLLWHGGVAVARNMNTLHLMFGIGAFGAPLLVDRSVDATGNLVLGLYPVLIVGLLLGGVLVLGPPAPAATTEKQRTDRPAPTFVQLAAMALFFFVYVGAEVGFGGWVFTYAKDAGRDAGSITAGFWGAFTVGRLAVAVLGDRLTPKQVLFGSGSLAALGAIVLVSANHSGPLVPVGIALVGAGVAPQFPTMLLFADRRVSTSGSSMSVFLAAAGAGAASIPWLMGQVIDGQGSDVLPALGLAEMVAVMAITALVSAVLPKPVT